MASRYLNGLAVTLRVGDGRRLAVPQTGPGTYATSVTAPAGRRSPRCACGGRVVERFAVPGRYPPEFDAVGTDRAALRALADRTGGAVVEPSATAPLTFPGPPRRTDLTPPLATAGRRRAWPGGAVVADVGPDRRSLLGQDPLGGALGRVARRGACR